MIGPLPDRGIGMVGWYYILVQLYLVWASFRSRKKVDQLKTLPPRTRHFITTIIMQGLYLSLTLLVARYLGITLFPQVFPRPLEIAAGFAAAALLACGMYPLWKRAVAKRPRRLYFFMPSGAKEKALWTGVSVAAGIGEEATYRGVLYVLLMTLTGSAWAGALLSALVFAGGHAFQSRLSMVIIFFFALAFQGLAIWTGALYVSMLAHVVYDIVVGFTYSRLGRQMGYVAEGAPDAAPQRGTAPATGSSSPA